MYDYTIWYLVVWSQNYITYSFAKKEKKILPLGYAVHNLQRVNIRVESEDYDKFNFLRAM